MVSAKKVIAFAALCFLVLILIAIVFGPSEYTGKTIEVTSTTSSTETTTKITKVKTTTSTLIATTEQPSSTVQPKEKIGCEELGCPPGTKFVGSKSSNKYHRCDCVWAQKIKPENIVCFKNAEEASSMGYVPCKVCKP